MLSLVRLERKQKILQIRNFEFAHFSFFLTGFELSDKPRSYTTSFPGFSPTRPTELRRAGRREPWERGWFIHSRSSLKNHARSQTKMGKVYRRFHTKTAKKHQKNPMGRHIPIQLIKGSTPRTVLRKLLNSYYYSFKTFRSF